jgi:predicted  nucleic acid-binding Zn-ribbon protein
MTETDYRTAFENALLKLAELSRQKQELEISISKMTQYMQATLEMLSNEDRDKYISMFKEVVQSLQHRQAGLTQAIRDIFQAQKDTWITVSQVRDRLAASGFDFSEYTANPLASISTTMRRMKELESAYINGVTGYRWRQAPP